MALLAMSDLLLGGVGPVAEVDLPEPLCFGEGFLGFGLLSLDVCFGKFDLLLCEVESGLVERHKLLGEVVDYTSKQHTILAADLGVVFSRGRGH